MKRKNEEAAKRFARDSALWLREIESGRSDHADQRRETSRSPRRIVMSRCYGNPVPRRNATDNSTDMNSFPFVRHHFLRAGFEVIDCPPLTAQLKNSADIRMVMDVRDMLNHETRFEEFILMSGDADFTPVLHRLRRMHAAPWCLPTTTRRSPIPLSATARSASRTSSRCCSTAASTRRSAPEASCVSRPAPSSKACATIVAEVVSAVRAAGQPVPLEALADRAVRALGHDKTVGSAWGGAGTFRDLLSRAAEGRQAHRTSLPYFAYEPTRQIARDIEARPEAPVARERRIEAPEARYEPRAGGTASPGTYGEPARDTP